MVRDGRVLGGRWTAPGAGGVREVGQPARVRHNAAAMVAGRVRAQLLLSHAVDAVLHRQPLSLC